MIDPSGYREIPHMAVTTQMDPERHGLFSACIPGSGQQAKICGYGTTEAYAIADLRQRAREMGVYIGSVGLGGL